MIEKDQATRLASYCTLLHYGFSSDGIWRQPQCREYGEYGKYRVIASLLKITRIRIRIRICIRTRTRTRTRTRIHIHGIRGLGGKRNVKNEIEWNRMESTWEFEWESETTTLAYFSLCGTVA